MSVAVEINKLMLVDNIDEILRNIKRFLWTSTMDFIVNNNWKHASSVASKTSWSVLTKEPPLCKNI